MVRLAEEKPPPTHRVTFANSHQFMELVYLERAAGRHRLGAEEPSALPALVAALSDEEPLVRPSHRASGMEVEPRG